MAAYLIVTVHVSDPAQFERYRAEVPGVIAQFGGRYLVRGGATAVLEGTPDTGRTVVLEFPSMDAVKQFWNSPYYLRVKRLREGAAVAHVLAVEGV